MLLSRSQTAFNWSADKIPPNRKGHIYLWTWTFAGLVEVKEAKRRWSAFLKKFRRWNKYKGFRGLRVFEMHKSGHGLHIHVVTDNFLRVNDVRRIWNECGGGRIDVKPIAWERRYYVGKYLSKARRPQCLKGARLWDAFGGFDRVRCKDIEIVSDFTTAYKALCAAVEGFSKLNWNMRQRAVNSVLMGDEWHRGFGGIEFDLPTGSPPSFGGVGFTNNFNHSTAPENAFVVTSW